mgnify:CR=1 FL=1
MRSKHHLSNSMKTKVFMSKQSSDGHSSDT